ncbi:MAG: transcriptional repressor NrdR [Lachnospiraceae bacterium]|nr:transcriptional repressor NrdR [Lachnospiraceae bacterium]
MKCPFCGNEDTRVIDSRPAEDGSSIRRRRQCDNCDKRFTTYEKIETIPMIVIKKDNIREKYDRDKVWKGIITSCHKRPVSTETINKMIDEIEAEIFGFESKEVPSHVIGEKIMEKLQKIDQVAYVRFASVYREFQDVDTFMSELQKIIKKHEGA